MMKLKHYSCLLAIAAVLAVTAITTLTACSSENDLAETPNGAQPQTPTTNGVQVTVGAGLADDASTRSTVENDGTKRTLKFTTGDRLYVYGEIDANTSVAGYLTMAGSPTNDDKSATFTGAVKAYDISGATPVEKAMPAGDDPLALCTHKATKATLVHQNLNTNAISITLGANVELYTAYMSAADVNTLMTTSLPVQGDYASASKSFTLSSDSPIINCTLSGFEANSSHEVGLYYETSSVWIQSFRSTFTADANGVISVAFVSQHSGSENWKMTIGFPSDNYDIDLGTKDLTAKVYNVTRNFVNLANVTAEKTLQNGDIVTGTLGGNYKVSIAAGATVTLSGATIPGRNATDLSTPWAGLTCLGDATIVLADGTQNSVKGYSPDYPGIQAGPAGTTLTIRGGSAGTGKLTAHCGMGTTDGYGAGIGGGYNMSVGNIRIEGGDITATANRNAAGIGSGFAHYADASCGDITITGGTVTATGGYQGAGIGSGIGASPQISSCGNISITGGTVYSTGGQYAPGIGSGDNDSSCGDISITGTATGWAQGGTNSPRNIGAGSDSNASCGTVSVTAANFHNGMPTAPCTLKVTIYVSDGVTGSYRTCETITINDGNNTYTVNPTFSGSDMNRYAMISFDLLAPRTYATLTISGTGGQCNPYTYSAVINNVEVSPDVAKDLGTVNLVRQ
jgi:hypothetical protein